ncbi:MAG: alkaline phosphatase family protein [Chitinophagales bacterium]|nr:alkaline phosphatase family protein [Chitinophagales bacterium]
MSKRIAKKVLLVGWDAADWKVINPLMDNGIMPTLNQFVNDGVIGNLATLDPPLSPILWTSIATGKLADKHGILGFVEPDSKKMEVRPSLSTSRKVKAIWNILSQEGFKSNVVGWWPSHPAEPINGVMVSNFYQKAVSVYHKPWPMAAGTVHPKDMEEVMREMRVHPAELTLSHMAPFFPNYKDIDQEKDGRMAAGAKILAHSASIHNAATWIMENTEWDFMAVYHDAIDHYSHSFMRFYPPQRPGIPDDLYHAYKDAVSGMYRFHDMMLERYLELAGEDTTVIIMSDHGFHSDHLRPNRLPKEPAGPAYEHSPYGIVCIKGPAIQTDQRVYGATLLDITPTLLTMFGLPVGKDMDGKVLSQIFEEPVQPEFIESWEQVPGDSGMHAADQQEDPWAAKEAMQQLVELGYIDAPGEDKQKNLDNVTSESQYYLARVLTYRKDWAKAAEILEEIFTKNQELRYGLALINCYQKMRKVAEYRSTLDKVRALEAGNMVKVDIMEASLLLLEYKPRKALELLLKAEQEAGHISQLHVQIGRIYLKSQQYEAAERAFIKALSIDSQQANAHHGLALTYLRQEKFEEAAEECLNAIGLSYYYPIAHFHLGEALMNLEEYERAADAFEVCCAIAPGNRKAHLWLIKLYEEKLNNNSKAEEHRKFINERIKGTITVVTGLPRSGTSMMMQMLEAGGEEILTDKIRTPDENNPKGYWEFEKVKKVMTDVSWLDEATGKVVKIVAPLLSYLPPKYDYKIIFMQRDMAEILRSQQIMLGKKTEIRKNAYPIVLSEAFKKQLEQAEAWLKRSPNAELLYVDYTSVIDNPSESAENVAEFLGAELNIQAMTEVVDIALYRNRASVGDEKK